nr:MAG TPA: hypothetical protein [Bacteriophage sp.]
MSKTKLILKAGQISPTVINGSRSRQIIFPGQTRGPSWA